MTFDNEEDRQLAMACVTNAPVAGPAKDVGPVLNSLQALLAIMETAEIVGPSEEEE